MIAMDSKIRLEDLDYRVVTAANFKEAVDSVRNFPIDLVLMDINLGEGQCDGIDTAAEIKKFSDVPVIFFSSCTDRETINRTEKVSPFGFIPKNTDINLIDASVKTALRLFRNSKKSLVDDVLNTIPTRVFWKDLNSVYMGCNKKFAMDSGKDNPEQIIGLTDYEIRDKATAGFNIEDDIEILNNGTPKINYEEQLISASGEKEWILTSKIPLRDDTGGIYGLLGMYENITDRKRMEDELVIQKNRLSSIIYGSNVGTWEWNLETNENVINSRWAEIIGYTVEELENGPGTEWKQHVHPDDLPRTEKELNQYMSRGLDYFEYEFRMRHKLGHWVWVVSRGKVIDWDKDGKPLLLAGTHSDVTERKQAEEEIRNQLAEKDFILKEVHHRIKNNFATIGSLLSMHQSSIKNEEAAAALQDAIGRVFSMQSLYDKLLLAEDFINTSIKNYLCDLIDDILKVFPEINNITVETHIVDCVLSSKHLFYLGLIINELLTDVMKYAFTGRDSGHIWISLDKDEDDLTLVIQDDGNGLPDDFNSRKGKGFGLMLVDILSKQLSGDFSIETSNGTRSSFKFRIT